MGRDFKGRIIDIDEVVDSITDDRELHRVLRWAIRCGREKRIVRLRYTAGYSRAAQAVVAAAVGYSINHSPVSEEGRIVVKMHMRKPRRPSAVRLPDGVDVVVERVRRTDGLRRWKVVTSEGSSCVQSRTTGHQLGRLEAVVEWILQADHRAIAVPKSVLSMLLPPSSRKFSRTWSPTSAPLFRCWKRLTTCRSLEVRGRWVVVSRRR